MRIFLRIFGATAVVALLAGPAYAQAQKPVPRYGDMGEPKSQQEIESDKAAARAYNNSLKNIPDQAPVDPWGGARSTDTPKSAAKAAPKSAAKTAPKTAKTNGTIN